MIHLKQSLALLAGICLAMAGTARAVTYTQTFDGNGSGLPSGWSVSNNATATSIGNQTATYNAAAVPWSTTTGQFSNSASATGLLSTSTAAEQAASTNRALGLRQTGAFGDPGAAFNFTFSTTGATISNISLDLMMLSVQGRSTTFSIQYGIGPNPTSFTNLGTYLDPGNFGTTPFSFTTVDFGTALNNQANVVIRIVALGASTGANSRDTVGLDNFSITSDVDITPIPVPEPATYMLFGMGLLVCAQQFRRRRAAANK